MKKIPITIGAAIGVIMVIIFPVLGVSWWSVFDPSDNPNECYVQSSDGSIEPCKIETGPRIWPSLNVLDQDCEESCDVPIQAQSPFTEGVTEIVNPEHRSLKYYKTPQVIDDTYLGKNVKQWQDAWDFELESGYNMYQDEFYENMGKLLIKNEMQRQLDSFGLVNSEEDFEIAQGFSLQSLPPHIGFSSIIHATDGHYYWMQGSTHSNKVSYYKTTQLQYPDESKFPEIEASTGLLRVSVYEEENDLIIKPRKIILANPGEIEFYNYATEKMTLRIKAEGAEYALVPEGISTRSNSGLTYPLSSSGTYTFDVRVPKNENGDTYNLRTGGSIIVLGDEMYDLPLEKKIEMTKGILASSGLPIVGMGQNAADTIRIDFDSAIEEFLPESKPYYLKAAQSIVPFDTIKIVLG